MFLDYHDLSLLGCWGRGHRILDSSSLCPFVQEPDTDLEVVLEKKGNMDEAHIDQVRPRSSSPFHMSCHPPGTHWSTGQQDPGPRGVRDPKATSQPQAHLTRQGTYGLPHLMLGDPFATTALAEGPSDRLESQAEGFPYNCCTRDGIMTPGTAARVGDMCSARHCHLLASIQKRLENLLCCGSAFASVVPRPVGRCIPRWSMTLWNWGICMILDQMRPGKAPW